MAQGAPSNTELLRLWQRIAVHTPPLNNRGTRLSRLFSSSRRGDGSSRSSRGGTPSRLAHWLSGSRAGRSLSWLLRLPTVPEGGGAAGLSPGRQAGPEEVDGDEGGREVMEIAGDTVDLDGLTLVLSAANAAAGGELAPAEVRASAQAILHR